MKRLAILTVVAVLAITSSGCGRNWGSWLFNRNDYCEPECEMYYGENPGVIYEGPVVDSVPSSTVLPGPAPRSND